MTQAIVRRAFEATLKTWADAQPLSVAWENRAFTPTNGTTYLRAFLLPIATASDDLGRVHRRYEGIFQVSICLPLGTGPGAGEAIVSALSTLFTPSTVITQSGLRIFVMQPLSPAPAIPEPDRYVIPCSLTYRADTY